MKFESDFGGFGVPGNPEIDKNGPVYRVKDGDDIFYIILAKGKHPILDTNNFGFVLDPKILGGAIIEYSFNLNKEKFRWKKQLGKRGWIGLITAIGEDPKTQDMLECLDISSYRTNRGNNFDFLKALCLSNCTTEIRKQALKQTNDFVLYEDFIKNKNISFELKEFALELLKNEMIMSTKSRVNDIEMSDIMERMAFFVVKNDCNIKVKLREYFAGLKFEFLKILYLIDVVKYDKWRDDLKIIEMYKKAAGNIKDVIKEMFPKEVAELDKESVSS
jgi:hypothetical protein